MPHSKKTFIFAASKPIAMWVVLSLISAFLLGFYDIFKKQTVVGNAIIPVLFYSTMISCLLFLPFVLLSDPERKAIEAYGVWQEKKMCGKVSMGVVRTTFVIDEKGVIEKVMPKVKPDTNAAEILAYLKGE